MSKTTVPCSSCPAAAAEKVVTPKDNKIIFVLEDFSPTSSDSVVKVKQFKKFLDYDLKTLNITGHLQKYVHINGLTHVKMLFTYQDKTTNKVDCLELDFINNKKTEENKNTVGGRQNPNNCTPECFFMFAFCIIQCGSSGVVNSTTEESEMSLKTTTKIKKGTSVKMKITPDGVFNILF